MKRSGVLLLAIFSMTVIFCADAYAATPSHASSTSPSRGSNPPVQTGGTLTVIMNRAPSQFGYPPRIGGPDKDYIAPIFEHLLAIGNDGAYEPELATSWDVTPDGKAITFKLRKGVKFHDGTDFNAQAVKFNFEAIIPPKGSLLEGVQSVDVIDAYTVRVNLPISNNLILYQIANSSYCNIASPTAIAKNGVEWAYTHPVGTGPFKLERLEPNSSCTLVRNKDYWEKDVPYLEAIHIKMVSDPMTQMLTFKSGQADAIYNVEPTAAAQLRDDGWPLLIAPAAFFTLSFDVKNNKILGDVRVRQAIEYAIDKEAICRGPGFGLFEPLYQIVTASSSGYNNALPPRKFNPQKAKQLLAEAGYPDGFAFKAAFLDSYWREGVIAIQSYLAKVGMKMDINFVNSTTYTSRVRVGGNIDPGTAAMMGMEASGNSLYNMYTYFRNNASEFQYVAKPRLSGEMIGKAMSFPVEKSAIPLTKEIAKILYDDETVVPLWLNPRIIVLNKSIQNTGWFVHGDAYISQFGRNTWLKK